MWENQGMTKRCRFNLYQIKLAAAQLNTSLRPEIQTLKLLWGYISNPVRLSQTVPKVSLQGHDFFKMVSGFFVESFAGCLWPD